VTTNPENRPSGPGFDLPALEDQLASLPGLVVAFSGGVDSTALLAAACDLLGTERVLAATADSASMARSELAEAEALAAEIGVSLSILATEEMQDPRYLVNQGDRCFWCKEQLFSHAAALADARGWPLAYGENADDCADDRPGARSAAQRGVLAPLRDAGWSKAQVRTYARHRGLRVAEKPAAPCLSSRIAVGIPVTLDALERIEKLEAAIKLSGYAVVRARHLGGAEGILEFEAQDLVRAEGEWSRLRALAADFGFLDCSLRAYRSGSVAL